MNRQAAFEPNQSSQPQLGEFARRLKDIMFEREDQMDQSATASRLVGYKEPIFNVDDMSCTFLNMNKSFEYVGDNSTFQKRITCILVFQWIVFSLMVNSMAYFFRTPKFVCKLIPLTDIFIPCSEEVACKLSPSEFIPLFDSEKSYFSASQYSIAQEFSLYCGNSKQPTWAQSMFFLGSFLSGYLFSYLAERIGRRPVLMISMSLTICSIVLCAFAWDFQIFIIGYFFAGFSLFGYETNVYIYIGEISAIRFRIISINILTMMWAGTPIFIPFIRLIPTWRQSYLIFATILLGTMPFAYHCFLESPRFLLSKKCYDQVKEIFGKISVTNRRPPYRFKLMDEMEQENEKFMRFDEKCRDDSNEKRQISTMKHYNYLDLFRYSSLKKITIVLMYWRILQYMMYFSLNLALQSIFKSEFLLTLTISLAAIAEVLGSFGMPIMTTFLFKKFKLDIMRIAIGIISVCCTIMAFVKITQQCSFVEEQSVCPEVVIMIFLVLIFKFFNTVFFSGLIVYSSEIFPTPVRSLGYGFTATFGRLGSILVPFYIKYVKINYADTNALAFFAPLMFFAFFLSRIMPNSEQFGMRETIEEEDFRARTRQMHDI